ncbi:60S ribosomal protein L10a, partial [Trypanosoma cruzi]
MSKIPPAQLSEAIQAVLTNRKERKFKESIDLQVNLKNYDPQKDKRFSGSVRLPHVCRPRMTVCLLCDLVHEDIAKKNNVPTMNQEELKKLNKNKKLVKKIVQSVRRLPLLRVYHQDRASSCRSSYASCWQVPHSVRHERKPAGEGAGD